MAWDGDAFPDLDWDNNLNWDSDSVPLPTDDITIPPGFNVNINSDKTHNGSLTIDSTSQIILNTGNLTMGVTGFLNVSGTLNIPGTGATNFGSVTNNNLILINGGGSFTNKNTGIINNEDGGNISTNFGSSFVNEADGIVNNKLGSVVTTNDLGTLTENFGIINNSGKLLVNVNGAFINRDGGVIQNNDEGDISNNNGGTFTNEKGGTININDNSVINNNDAGTTFENFGELTNFNVIRNRVGATFVNEDGAVINNVFGAIINNFETSLMHNKVLAVINNDGEIFNHCNAIFENFGLISPNPIIDLPCPPEPEVVAGDLLPIDSTALFLAGLSQSMVWMIPTVLGLAGVGVIIRAKIHRD